MDKYRKYAAMLLIITVLIAASPFTLAYAFGSGSENRSIELEKQCQEV